MDALQQHVQRLVEGKIDFEGQKLVELIIRVALPAITILSFIPGFALQSLRVTFGVFGLLTVLLFLVVLPQWPMYNRHPVVWLPVKEQNKSK